MSENNKENQNFEVTTEMISFTDHVKNLLKSKDKYQKDIFIENTLSVTVRVDGKDYALEKLPFIDFSKRELEEKLSGLSSEADLYMKEVIKEKAGQKKPLYTEVFFDDSFSSTSLGDYCSQRLVEKGLNSTKENIAEIFSEKLRAIYDHFAIFFVFYTKARRDGRKSILNDCKERLNSYIDLFTFLEGKGMKAFLNNVDFCQHLKNMARAILMTYNRLNSDERLRSLMKDCRELCDRHPDQKGYINHYGEVVANFYSSKLESLFVPYNQDELDRLKVNESAIDATLLKSLHEHDLMYDTEILIALQKVSEIAKDDNTYAKFHLTYGRLLALAGDIGKAKEQFTSAIDKEEEGASRKANVARDEDYLREAITIRAFLDMKQDFLTVRDAQEQIKSEKITNIAYVSIFSTLVGFVTATLSSFSNTPTVSHLAVLVSLLSFACGFVISLVLLFILLVNKKKVSSHRAAYAIVIGALVATLIAFVLIFTASACGWGTL